MRPLLLVLCVLLVAGCGGTTVTREAPVRVEGEPNPAPVPGAPVPDGAVRIAVVTHGAAASKFWSIVRNGAEAAAQRLDVLVDYRSPDVYSVARMSGLIDQAVATKPDGLVISIPDPGLAPAIRRAVRAGIPVVSINSGSDVFRKLGVLAHVGQLEHRAGLEAGRRLARAGVRRALCLNQEVGTLSLDDRCAGLAQAMTEAGGRSRVLAIDDEDPRLPEKIAEAVAADRADGVLATNSLGGLAAAKAGTGANVGTFDLIPEVIEAVQAGQIDFAVDQQAFLQGYLPVEMLALRARFGLFPAQHDVIATGPNFVTRENAAQALELSRRSIR